MNDLKLFNYESKQVRTVIINSEPWWVAKDVCDILELTNPSMCLQNLDADERSKLNLGRQGETNIVNESGLYSLVIQSRKPEAKKFKKWITSEVLPSIRKTGSYSAESKEYYIPKTYVEALRLAANQAEQIEEMKPKADEYDLFINNKSHQKIGDVAKTLNIKPNTLHRMLRDAKILQANHTPYAGYEHYFHTVNNPIKGGFNVFTSYLKPEGISYIVKRFNLTIQLLMEA